MAFDNDLSITVDSTTTTYSLVNLDNFKSQRKNSARDIAVPEILTISHQETKNGVSRRMVRLDNTIEVNGEYHTDTVHLVVTHGPNATKADITALLARLVAITDLSVFIDKFLNGEP